MLMALPNRDGSFTGTIYMESKGSQDSFEQMNHPARVSEFVQQHYPNALPLVGGRNKMVDQVQNNPEGVLGTVRTDKWALNGSLLLIGDAAHAMVPFFGQGCNLSLIHISEPTRLLSISYAVFCLKKKKKIYKTNTDLIKYIQNYMGKVENIKE
eukprot:TRINITY_DN19852_c0_g1_i3.p1 TRINITY_DN19852_c0_g1~~TRINITY_DN19852_c0_g1_i3.p1  ORF type:complete len:154 (-),score=26.29 TRINITY_DN19852_c0_g1_i3:60-521(-)